MKNEISKFASVTAGIILFTFIALLFVGTYVLLGLWFVVIPAILGAFIGSKRYDTNNVEGFTQDDINYYVDPKVEINEETTIH